MLRCAYSDIGLLEQCKACARESKKKTDLRTNLQELGVAQHEVVAAFKQASEAEFFAIAEKEGVLVATLMAWQHKAKEIKNRLGRAVNQQLVNMSRDSGPEFFACLSGLKATNIDCSTLYSLLHATLTRSQVHMLVETLFCVKHFSLAPYARKVHGQTTLGKILCAQIPCVMIHFRSQCAVLVARDRLLDIDVDAL